MNREVFIWFHEFFWLEIFQIVWPVSLADDGPIFSSPAESSSSKSALDLSWTAPPFFSLKWSSFSFNLMSASNWATSFTCSASSSLSWNYIKIREIATLWFYSMKISWKNNFFVAISRKSWIYLPWIRSVKSESNRTMSSAKQTCESGGIFGGFAAAILNCKAVNSSHLKFQIIMMSWFIKLFTKKIKNCRIKIIVAVSLVDHFLYSD